MAQATVRRSWRSHARTEPARMFGPAEGYLAAAVVSGLIAIYLSSRYANLFPLRTGPLWYHYPPAAIMAVVITGVLLLLAVAMRPDLLWPVLVGSAIITGGMFLLGFPIFDEWLAACVVAGAAIGAVRADLPRRVFEFRRQWVWLFALCVTYLAAEGIRGLAAYHNVKSLRPVFDSVVLLGALALLTRYRFPRLLGAKAGLFITACGAGYVGIYLLHGVLFPDLVFGRLIFEGVGGAGKAFATFPLAVTIPATFLLLQTQFARHRVLSWLTLLAVWVLVILSASRGGIFAVTAGTLLLARWKPKEALRLGVAFGALYLILVVVFHFWVDFLPIQYAKMLRAFYVIPQIAARAPMPAPAANPGLPLAIRGSGARAPTPAPAANPGLPLALRRSGATAPTSAPAANSGLPLALRRSGATAVAQGDTERQILLRASAQAIARKPTWLFIGVGTYGYWPKVGPTVQTLRARLRYHRALASNGSAFGPGGSEPPRPPAWPVFISETGAIGVLLIAANAAAAIWFARVRGRWTMRRIAFEPGPAFSVAALVFLLGWGAFAELQDKILWFLMLMPFGVVDAWTSPDDEAAGDA